MSNTNLLPQTLDSIAKEGMEFNMQETLQVLQHNKPIFWSWGADNFRNYLKKCLFFDVKGRHHKGKVAISLSPMDVYVVHILSHSGEILDKYDMVYFDDLVDVIDNRIERIADYKY